MHVEPELLLIGKIHDQKAEQRAHHGVRVFETMRDVGKILAARGPVAPGLRRGVEQIPAAERRRAEQDPRRGLFRGLLRPERGIERHGQRQRQHERHAHIQRRVHAQIHPRERHEHHQHRAHDPHPFLLPAGKERGRRADDVLRVAGGEGVAGRVRAGGLDDLKLRVEHPWARDAEGKLQKLVADRAERTDQKHIIPLPLIDAPEHQQRRRHKRQLRAEIRQAGEKTVQHGGPPGREKTQKSHSRTS